METIGDAYMAVTNLVDPDPHHAATMVRFALRAQEEAAKVPQPGVDDGSSLRLRVGERRDVDEGIAVDSDRDEHVLLRNVDTLSAGLT